ncbi:DNA alkylation repair protein [Mediterraneibacter agrestimuris]|uniref:DNA alkylation repair protein n=1 Tax=Mediterraneibacter agrestimuris TaxID=2941333 RepID=UPI00203B036C|nr:DNA alkylation repair protein [Mediterraneibacter agrestimuris]
MTGKEQKDKIRKVRKRLECLPEEDYKAFNQKLLPGVEHILGVRIPAIRIIAKEVVKGDFYEYLNEAEDGVNESSYHEELILLGLILGYAKMDKKERTVYLDTFVPKISNWAICDTCTMNMKFMQKEQDYWYSYILKYKSSNSEFELRFLLVALLAHFIDEEHIDDILHICNVVHHNGYYVKMAAAWLVSICYIKFPEKTGRFLENNEMDDFTHNKSIQKIRESYRVSKEEKERLNLLKRKELP